MGLGLHVTVAAHCWCGRTQAGRACVFHGADLQERVEAVLNRVSAIDAETGDQLPMGQRWLAWVVGSSKVAARRTDGVLLIGDVEVSNDNTWNAVEAFTAFEMGAVTGAALRGEWPW